MTRHEFIAANDLNLADLEGYDVVPCADCDEEQKARICPGWIMKRVADFPEVFIWLDDMRPLPKMEWQGPGPAPTILHLKTIDQVKRAFGECQIIGMSLDHDLGACDACMNGRTVEQWFEESMFATAPHCEHVGTGYDLVKWMAEHGMWPQQRPMVHSANTAGALNMTGTISRYFGTRRWSEDA